MSSRSRPSKSVLVGVAFLLVGMIAGACDQLTGSSSTESERLGAEALTFSHMPMGNTLPSPDEVPLERGMVRPDQEPTTQAQPRLPRSKGTAKKAGTPSPYGCYLASRPYSEAVAFRSVYLYFPREMVTAAEKKTRRLLFSLQAASIGPGALADADTAAVMERAGKVSVRYAHCVMPDAEGAETLAREQLVRAGETEAVREAMQEARNESSTLNAKRSCTTEEITSSTCAGGYCGDWQTEYEQSNCGLPTPTGGGPASDGGTGFPDDGGGSNPDRDGNRNCDSSKSLSKRLDPGANPGPGSECPPAEAPDDDVDETEVCPQDPLKDMDIRETCSGVEGGRFGWTREDENGEEVFHGGTDLLADKGTRTEAVFDGSVWSVNRNESISDFGKYVIIQSSENPDRFVMYAHLSETSVEGGENVIGNGTKIGETGTSGNACPTDCSCGPSHLHIGVRTGSTWGNGDPVNPEETVLGTEFNSNGTPVSDDCGS